MASSKTYYPAIGSISSGTMRAEDLIPAFMAALDDIKEGLSFTGPDAKDDVARIDAFLAEIEEGQQDQEEWPEDGMDVVSDLEDMLNTYAAPYCYFGSHPGDGADFGYWPCLETLEEDAREGVDVLKIAAGDQWPEDEIRERQEAGCAPSYVLEVNERGNATLWTATAREDDRQEVWSVV